MDLEDVQSGLLVRRRELDLPVDPARPEQGRVQDVNPVCRHDHLEEFDGKISLVRDLFLPI